MVVQVLLAPTVLCGHLHKGYFPPLVLRVLLGLYNSKCPREFAGRMFTESPSSESMGFQPLPLKPPSQLPNKAVGAAAHALELTLQSPVTCTLPSDGNRSTYRRNFIFQNMDSTRRLKLQSAFANQHGCLCFSPAHASQRESQT